MTLFEVTFPPNLCSTRRGSSPSVPGPLTHASPPSSLSVTPLTSCQEVGRWKLVVFPPLLRCFHLNRPLKNPSSNYQALITSGVFAIQNNINNNDAHFYSVSTMCWHCSESLTCIPLFNGPNRSMRLGLFFLITPTLQMKKVRHREVK